MPTGATPCPQTLPDRWIARADADDIAETVRCAHNAGFERRELARLGDFFEHVLPQPLNQEQRAAIVVDEDATLVVASAGSGKTTLLLGKIAYLVMRGLAQPGEIALLAFNNSVRAEIGERLASSHPGVAIHTFHSLGLELLRAASGGACRLSPMATDGARLQAFLDTELRALALQQPDALAEWLAAHTDPLRDAADFASPREWKVWSRAHPPLTLHGARVRSHALRELVDRLTLGGAGFRTDASLRVGPGLPPYAPDILLPAARLVIDVGDGQPGVGGRHGRSGGRSGAGSREGPLAGFGRALLARLACLRHGLRRVRLDHAARLQREGRLGERLAQVLAARGIRLDPGAMPAALAEPAAATRLADTVSLLATCLALGRGGPAPFCDAPGDSGRPDAGRPESGHPEAGRSDPRDVRRRQAFAGIFLELLSRYEAHLSARGEIDFGDMIARAATALDQGSVRVPFRYLLVDEFQDISAGRAALVKSLRRSRPGMKLLAVGDDWQSIYRFAGSDVGIMTAFEAHFGHTETRFLRRTFRFDRRLEAVASAFVLRNPAQIRKQVEAREPDTAAPAVVLWLPTDSAVDDPMPGIAADLFGPPAGPVSAGAPHTAATASPGPRPDVLILGRYRSLLQQARLDWLAEHYPQADWRFSTIHRAKGATADHAVVLGVRGGRQPFPAERPEDPLLAGFLGSVEAFPFAEERRLFYVALTRARRRVYVVGDRRRPSPFFDELLARGDCAVAGWDNLATCLNKTA